MRADPTKPPSDTKLMELVLFIAHRSARDERFGATKLNKILFYSDFLAFAKLGSSITGQAYQKLENGPAPKRLVPVVKQMVERRTLAIQDRPFHGHTQKVPIPLREPNLTIFSAPEIAIVTEVIQSLWRKNAKGVSTLSHQFNGWKFATLKETIPYQVALVQFKKPRKADIQKAIDIREELEELRQEMD